MGAGSTRCRVRDDRCNAQPGDRNAALNKGAYNIYQIVHGNPGLLDEEEVRRRLFAAAEACGLVARRRR